MGVLSCWFVELLSCYGVYPANLAGVPDALSCYGAYPANLVGVPDALSCYGAYPANLAGVPDALSCYGVYPANLVGVPDALSCYGAYPVNLVGVPDALSCYGAYPANLAGVPDALTFFSPPFPRVKTRKGGGCPQEEKEGAPPRRSRSSTTPRGSAPIPIIIVRCIARPSGHHVRQRGVSLEALPDKRAHGDDLQSLASGKVHARANQQSAVALTAEVALHACVIHDDRPRVLPLVGHLAGIQFIFIDDEAATPSVVFSVYSYHFVLGDKKKRAPLRSF